MGMEPELCRDGDLSIRRMHDDDLRLFVAWRNEPHVAEWWDTDDEQRITLEDASAKYGPRTLAESSTTSCIIEVHSRPAGYIQCYPWGSLADEVGAMGLEIREGAFGIDVFLGDAQLLDRGIGSRAVELLSAYLFRERGADQIAITTSVDNLRAQHAYRKAGFHTVGRVLDTDMRGGERVPSYLDDEGTTRPAMMTRP